MSKSSFWVIPDVTSLRTPLSILKEQAEALSDQTKGVLIGEVEFGTGQSGMIFMTLMIIAPTLNNYRLKILRYRQPVALFPGMLSNEVDGIGYEIKSEEEFIAVIKEILGSENMKRIVGNLLSQAGIS